MRAGLLLVAGILTALAAERAGAAPGASERLADARRLDAALRADERRLRFRHSYEPVLRAWRSAESSASGEVLASALEGEAALWSLLARRSGLASDAAMSADLARQAGEARARAKRRAVQPDSGARIRALRSDPHGRALLFDLEGEVEVRRGVLPGTGNSATRVYFDLSPAVLAREAHGLLGVKLEGVASVRTGQHRDRVARVVLELSDPALAARARFEPPARIALDGGPEVAARPAEDAPAPSAGPPAPPSDEPAPTGLVAANEERSPEAADRRPRPSVLAVRRIVIDAGHGGKDLGAEGPGGIHEKAVNLAIAKLLGEELEKELGVAVSYTRTTDRFVTLDRRSRIANDREADLFISIHANAHRSQRVHGIETYYLDVTSDAYAKRLAQRENTLGTLADDDLEPGGAAAAEDASLPLGSIGRDLRLILADLAMRSATRESKRLAEYVQGSMSGALKKKHEGIRNLGVKSALFYVLLGTRMPSVLVETGFVTHPQEGKRLADPTYQRRLAASIARGIARFVREREAVARRDVAARGLARLDGSPAQAPGDAN